MRGGARKPGAPWLVVYDGPCTRCGLQLLKGTPAIWDRTTRTMHCLECPTDRTAPMPFDSGVAGGSARREAQRRSAKRSSDLRERWGDRVGGWIDRLTVGPQSTRAWAIGAGGEERLGAVLAAFDGIRSIHDRAAPGTRGNIDHIVVAPAGVFVIDAKDWQGTIRVRDVGGWFRTDPRLYVGSRDATRLADGMTWQIAVVAGALKAAGVSPLPRIVPVLCFVGGQWPILRPPSEFRGVLLESERSIRKRFMATVDLDEAAIDHLASTLSRALPAKSV